MRLNAPEQRAWIDDPATRTVMAALDAEHHKARFVGGCVRNALLGRPIDDIDIATVWTPPETIRHVETAGLKAVPTGIDHGTVTAIVNGKPFEVTSLRKDVSTDGRRAVVAFTDDWAEDAARRDFTINALYADADGTIFDPLGGLADIDGPRIRFIGDPEARIREDYLRILRFFRFHAWYAQGPLDREGLDAIDRTIDGLETLSAERVQKEILRLLSAPDPVETIRTMDAAGVLSRVLPYANNVERFARLMQLDAQHDLHSDAIVRLSALLPDEKGAAEETAAALKLSKADAARLTGMRRPVFSCLADLDERAMRRFLYFEGAARVRDRALIVWAQSGGDAAAWLKVLAAADSWHKPKFPITAAMLLDKGIPKGPELGRILKTLEAEWVDQGFPADIAPFLHRVDRLRAP